MEIPTCPDGAPYKQPNLPIDLSWWGTGGTGTITCQDLSNRDNVTKSDNIEEYHTYLHYCGCNVPDSAVFEPLDCPGICDNGEPLKPEYHNVTVSFQDENGTSYKSKYQTCGEMALTAAWYAVDQVDDNYRQNCAPFTYFGNKVCGCTPRFPKYCEICEDGSLMQPPNEESELLCMYTAGVAYAIPADDEYCPFYQGSHGVYCGCQNPIASEGVCRLCGDDELLPNFTNVETTFFGTEEDPYLCADYEATPEITKSLYEAEGLPVLTCNDARRVVGDECCGGSSTSPSTSPSSTPSISPSLQVTITMAPSERTKTLVPSETTTTIIPTAVETKPQTPAPTLSPQTTPEPTINDSRSSAYRADIFPKKKSLLITLLTIMGSFVIFDVC